MNKKAKELKMTNTKFNNPSGLDQEKGNYSSAYDMAILTSYAMKNEDYRRIVGTKEIIVKSSYKNKVLSSLKALESLTPNSLSHSISFSLT